MSRSLLMLGLLGAASMSCATRQMVFQAPAVSMTTANVSGKVKRGGFVQQTYCADETPQLAQGQSIALVDEAIYKAQGYGKEADLILDSQVFREGNCVEVRGTLAKLEQ